MAATVAPDKAKYAIATIGRRDGASVGAAFLESVVSRFDGAKKSGRGYQVRCPAHEDRRPSLHISPSDDANRVLLKCHAGCATADILARVGLTFADLFDPRLRKQTKGKGPETHTEQGYDYTLNGTLQYQTVRKQYADHKDFTIRRPKTGGGWEYKIGDTPLILYHADDVREAIDGGEWLCVAEGEHCVDRLRKIGINATTNPLGAGKWKPEYADALAGAGVVVFCDHDQPGYRHALDVVRSLDGKAADIRIIRIVGLPEKADISDYIGMVGTEQAALDIDRLAAGVVDAVSGLEAIDVEELEHLAGESVDPPTGPLGNRIVWSRFSQIEEEEIVWIWPGHIAAGKLHLMAGVQGDGKSTVLAALAGALSSGGPLPDGTRVEPLRVGFLISEDGVSDTVLPRLRLHGADLDNVFNLEGVRTEHGEQSINLADHLADLRDFIVENGLKVLIVDALSDYLGGTKRNDDGQVRGVLTPLARMGGETGCAVVGVVHLGKPGAGDRRAIERVLGSGAFTQVPRIVLAVSVDPQDESRRFLGQVKNNLGPLVPTLAWHRDRDQAITWDGVAKGIDVRHVITATPGKTSAKDQARSFLERFLAAGAQPAEQVLQAGEAAGIGKNAVYAAADELGVSKKKQTGVRHGLTYWRLPDASPLPDNRSGSLESLRISESSGSLGSWAQQPDSSQLPKLSNPHSVFKFAGPNGHRPADPPAGSGVAMCVGCRLPRSRDERPCPACGATGHEEV